MLVPQGCGDVFRESHGCGNTAVIGKRVQRVRVRGGETVPECTPYPFTAG